MTSDRVGPPPSGRVGAEPGVSGAIGNSGFSSSGAGVGIVDDGASETVFAGRLPSYSALGHHRSPISSGY